jgi:hypothetical protein
MFPDFTSSTYCKQLVHMFTYYNVEKGKGKSKHRPAKHRTTVTDTILKVTMIDENARESNGISSRAKS